MNEEQYLLEMLASLRLDYERQAEPIIRQLSAIRAMRSPEPIFLTIDKAKAMVYLEMPAQPTLMEPFAAPADDGAKP